LVCLRFGQFENWQPCTRSNLSLLNFWLLGVYEVHGQS
jgi:hypothetical protein